MATKTLFLKTFPPKYPPQIRLSQKEEKLLSLLLFFALYEIAEVKRYPRKLFDFIFL